MEFSEIINYILYTVITVILPVIAKYIVDFIKTKIIESNIIAKTAQNENVSQIIETAFSDVMDSVLYVNQVYTDSLKASGTFDKDAQKKAFNLAYAKAVNIISDESKKVIEQLYGSFDKWLQLKIETSVNITRKDK